MPLYEFRCIKCGRVQEELRKSGDQTPPFCNECGSETGYKMSTSRAVFVGPVFYQTDYCNQYTKDGQGTKGVPVEEKTRSSRGSDSGDSSSPGEDGEA